MLRLPVFSVSHWLTLLLCCGHCVCLTVFTGTKDGIEVFAPDGKKLGTLRCGQCTNLAFVDDTLYGLCEQKIIAVKLQVAGATLP